MLLDRNTLWEIYNKIEEYAKVFCGQRFNYNQTKLEDCNSYVKDKVLDKDMRKIKQFKGKSSISTYAYVVTRNLFTDYTKKLSTNVKNYELNEEITLSNSALEAKIEFESLLKYLNLNQQLILILKKDELSSREIAPIVDMKSKEVDREYQKIKKLLQKLEK